MEKVGFPPNLMVKDIGVTIKLKMNLKDYEMNIFEKASRIGLTFPTIKGAITVTDLWTLPLTSNTGKVNLDSLAQDRYKVLNQTSQVSFVSSAPTADPEVELQLEILKHIIGVRLKENEEKNKATTIKAEREKLAELIQKCDDEALNSLSREELVARYNATEKV